MHMLHKKNETKQARCSIVAFRYNDRIYPIQPEIKDTTDTDRSASYIDLHLEIDSEGRLGAKVYDKTDYFNFPIVKKSSESVNRRTDRQYNGHKKYKRTNYDIQNTTQKTKVRVTQTSLTTGDELSIYMQQHSSCT